MTKSFNSADTKRIYYAAQDFKAWNEYVNMIRVLRTHFPESIKSPLELATMAYAAGIADGKHQERQRRRASIEAGDFALCVESDGMAPAFHAGDVLTIRRAAFSPEMQTRPGAVICQGGRYVLGRVAIEKDGSGTLYNGGGAIHFDADDFVGYAIAVQRDL